MAKLHSVLLLLSIAMLLRCSKQDVYKPPRPDYWGEAHMELNGDSIDLLPYGFWSSFNENTITIKLDRRNTNDELRESLNIFNIPQQTGNYSIITGILEPQEIGVGSFLGTYLDDGDVAGDIFRCDSALNNSYVEILEWDTMSQKITGLFYINLIRDKKYVSTPGYPDTILIQGDFFTKITEFH
jgi:hypothetical protein